MYTHIFSMNIQLFFNEEKNDDSMILVHRNLIPIQAVFIKSMTVAIVSSMKKKTESPHLLRNME